MSPAELLAATGFESAAPFKGASGTQVPTYLRQRTLPHIHLRISPEHATLDDVLIAAYEAGHRAGIDYLASRFNAFADITRGRPSLDREAELEARIKALEARLTPAPATSPSDTAPSSSPA